MVPKLTLTIAIIFATLLTTAGFIITRLFPEALIKVFSNHDANLIKIGADGLKIYFLMLPLLGLQLVAVSYFQAIGKYKESIFLSLTHRFIFLLLLLVLPCFIGYNGIWVSEPVSDFINFVFVVILLIITK